VSATASLAELFGESQTSRVRAWLYPSLLHRRRTDGRGCLLPGRDLWRGSPIDSRRPRGLRYTLLSGLVPALPLLLVRQFLPESARWREKRAEIRLERPHLSELFRPALLRTTLVATMLLPAAMLWPSVRFSTQSLWFPVFRTCGTFRRDRLSESPAACNCSRNWAVEPAAYSLLFSLSMLFRNAVRALHFFVPSLAVCPFLYFFAATCTLALLHLGIHRSCRSSIHSWC
jgi:hypothetical protein